MTYATMMPDTTTAPWEGQRPGGDCVVGEPQNTESAALVLAGGNGERLAGFTQRWLGAPVPKQYCTFVGTRSMLDHTLDRAARWCAPQDIVTVVARSHERILSARAPRPSDGYFVYQPTNRDTAAGVLLGLAYLVHRAPGATVAIFPADHFIYPEWRFLTLVRSAANAVRLLPDRLVLLGARADGLALDYGWITPGERLLRVDGRPVYAVRSFLEKPALAEAQDARDAGALWNTLVLVAKATTLWEAARRSIPELVAYFDHLRGAIGTPDELDVVRDIYRTMPARNFSTHVLQRVPDQIGVLPLQDVRWSDWGQPDRIVESLQAIGEPPSFPLQHLLDEPRCVAG